ARLGRGGCAADLDSSVESAEIPSGAVGGHGVLACRAAKERAASADRAMAVTRGAKLDSAAVCAGAGRSAIFAAFQLGSADRGTHARRACTRWLVFDGLSIGRCLSVSDRQKTGQANGRRRHAERPLLAR